MVEHLGECCEIQNSHLLGIGFLMTLNEIGAVKAFLMCSSFYNPKETLRRHMGVVKIELIEMNKTM